MDDQDRKALADLNIDVVQLKGVVESLKQGQERIELLIRDLRAPKNTNWIGIVSLGLSALGICGTFVWLFLNLRLAPIDKDLATITNEMKIFKAQNQREFEWFFEMNRMNREHTEQLIEKLWGRVYDGAMPKFTEKPKP